MMFDKLPGVLLLCYVVFIFLVLFAAFHPALMYIMVLWCLLIVIMDITLLNEKPSHSVMSLSDHVHEARTTGCKHTTSSIKGSAFVLFRDILALARLLSTSVGPAGMAALGGAAFVFYTQMQASVNGCAVQDLSALSKAGNFAFSCNDGFLPSNLQFGVPAFTDIESSGRRLDEILDGATTSGVSMSNSYGFVSPVFTSLTAFKKGSPPVVFAVKSGQPVKPASVNSDGGIKGLFVDQLQPFLLGFPTFPNYGMQFGFNLTHFQREDMVSAVQGLQRNYPDRNWGTATVNPTFIIAETVPRYFGFASTLLYVMYTLLAVGLFDRMVDYFSSGIAEAEREGNQEHPPYSDLSFVRDPKPVPPQSLWSQASGIWDDSLSTSAAKPWAQHAIMSTNAAVLYK